MSHIQLVNTRKLTRNAIARAIIHVTLAVALNAGGLPALSQSGGHPRSSLLLLIDASGSMAHEIGSGNPQVKIEAAKQAAIGTTAGAAQIPPIVAEHRCEGKPEGTACRQELVNHPECHIWTEFFEPGSQLSWSGKCKSGLAQGEGVLEGGSYPPPELGRPDGESYSIHEKGKLKDGKKHGRWIEERFDGMHASLRKGSYVDGKRQGRWVEDSGGRVISEGLYVDGEKHGHWLTKYFHGLIMEGPYFQGKKHGQWVFRESDGTVEYVTFKNDEKVRGSSRR